MKKYLPFILIIIAAVGIGYSFIRTPDALNNEQAAQNVAVPADGAATGDQVNNAMPGENAAPGNVEGALAAGEDAAAFEDIKPAAVAYKSAEEALEAIKKGAVDYDDTILEQFSMPGDDCTWCAQLYSSVKELLKSPDAKSEVKSFYAEILAISGKVDNVQALIDGFKESTKQEDKEVYGAALELVAGKDDVVEYLGKQLKTDNPELKESVVAALTNQGSLLALDTVYKNTVESGDPDGYYSMGIGLGEMILDEAALPKAQEYAQKRDAFAPLAVKALLNSGINGLRIVMDILASSTDPEADKKLIKDAVDHVNYDEQVEAYLKDKQNASQPLVREFANQIMSDFSQQDDGLGEEEGAGPPMSMNDSGAAQ